MKVAARALAARAATRAAACLVALCVGASACVRPGLAWLALRSPSRTVALSMRAPESSLEELARRMRWEAPGPQELALNDYRIEERSFEVYVPPGCGSGRSCGALIWIAPWSMGHLPRAWKPVLDRLGLVFVGANAAGNGEPLALRVNLALDAAHEVRTTLAADPQRLVVAGFSGGGRAASIAALLYPEVFSGGLFLMGADFFAPVPSSDPRWPVWLPPFPPPPAAALTLARERRAYVLVTAERDFNRLEIHDIARGYRELGFRRVSLLDVADAGHELPSAQCLSLALSLLDGASAPPGCAARREPAAGERSARRLRSASARSLGQ